MEHAYAQALWRLIDSGQEPTEAVRRVKNALEATGRLALLPRISRAVSRIAERARRGAPTLTVAGIDKKDAAIKEAMMTLAITEGTMIIVDEGLIGGWRYVERDRLVDTSYKNQLLDIYHRATR